MPVFNNALAGAAGSGGADAFKIERSLRFNSGDSAFLKRTASAGSNTTWTFSTWVKKTGRDNHIFGAGAGNNPGRFALTFDNSDKINVFVVDSGSTVYSQNSDAVFRDPSAWYHIIVVADTTNSTAADRLIVYVNGVRQTLSGGAMPLNQNTFVNTASAHAIGRRSYTASDYFDGYLADVHLVDGQALAATDFGAFDSDTGVWNPIKYSGTYGTNGFHLDFNDTSSNGTLGLDARVKGTRYSTDCTGALANNYSFATLFDGSTSTLCLGANGATLTFTPTTPIAWTDADGGVEIYYHNSSQQDKARINGGSWVNASNTGGWEKVSTGDGTLTSLEVKDQATSEFAIYAIRINGTILTDPAGANDWTVNNLVADVPGLSTANQGFNAVTWTGNGNSSRAIELGFQPDFLWIKRRDANQHHYLWDSIRGVTKEIHSDLDYAEGTATNKLASFDSNGFTVKNHAGTNQNGATYVAWAWKAGGTPVSNTNGTITSSVSANNTYGFSVVTYTGNSTAGATVGHGLSTAPSMIWVKNRSRAANWAVANSGNNGFANGNQLRLNTTGAVASSEEWFNNTNPTPSVFTVKNNYEVNYSGDNYVAYCWSEVSGFSKFGAYDGDSDNSNVTNRVIDCGFKPKYVLIKCSSNAGEEWLIFDGARNTSNPRNLFIKAESTNGESSYGGRHISFVDNGFKFEGTNGQEPLNLNGRSYIFAAFADVPDSTVIDSLIDTPTDYEADSNNNGGNHCTLNPLTTTGGNSGTSSATLSDGNLKSTNPGSASWNVETGTFGVSSGKWYYEYVLSGSISNFLGGWADPREVNYNDAVGNTARSYGYYSTGNVRNSNNNTSFGSSYTAGDVIGCAIDIDNKKIYWSKNGTWQNSADPAAGTGSIYTIQDPIANGFVYSPAVSTYDASSNVDCNFGQRPFAYTPPTGFKSLCTQNLDDPLIADGSEHMDVSLWTGNGGTKTVSGLNFEGDLFWLKSRSASHDHWLFDSVRGLTNAMYSNGTSAEYDYSPNGISATSDTGFTLTSSGQTFNSNNVTYVGWVWDGGDFASNSAYNQSAVWSEMCSPAPSIHTFRNGFDGNTTTTFAGGISAGSYFTFTPTGGLVFTNNVRVYNGGVNGASYKYNGGTATTLPANSWTTVATGGGTMTSFATTRNSTDVHGWYAIEVDGKILVDRGLIGVGGLNSSVYNTSENWVSTGTTTGTAYNSSYSFSPLFDGDLTGLGPQSNSTSTQYVYTFSSALSATAGSIIFYSTDNTANVPNANTGAFYINGTQVTTSNCTKLNNSSPYKYRMDGLTTLSSIGSQQKGNMTGIEVNGKLLIDSNAHTPPNVPAIASTVRANPTAGFSIVSWTGNGGIKQTLTHGLNAAPEMIIAKNRDSSVRWAVYHKGEGPGNTLVLNSTGTGTGGTGIWGNVYPTSSVFTISNDSEVNANSTDYIAYCWAPVEGYSAFGTYVGTGNADGPFVFLGFKPAVIIFKNIHNGSTQWDIYDTTRDPDNLTTTRLFPSTSGAESNDYDFFDVLSNGFKIRNNNAGNNGNGNTIIYAAWASNPFKHSRAH